MKSLNMTIQLKATRNIPYFSMVLFIMLYKVVLISESAVQIYPTFK